MSEVDVSAPSCAVTGKAAGLSTSENERSYSSKPVLRILRRRLQAFRLE